MLAQRGAINPRDDVFPADSIWGRFQAGGRDGLAEKSIESRAGLDSVRTMILEGIVTTRNEDATVNVAPMGPLVSGDWSRLTLRPFQGSRTLANLLRHPQGVFHVVDDALLLAEAAIDRFDEPPRTLAAKKIDGAILAEACRWYEFVVEQTDLSAERAVLETRVIHCGRRRDFFGFNRARHAVVEAAILATRRHLLPREEILAEFERLRPLIAKTGGSREQRALTLLESYVREAVRKGNEPA